MKFKQIKPIAIFCSIVMVIGLLAGCSQGGTLKIPVPKPKFTSIGYAISPSLSDNRLEFTYALVGFNEDKITKLYLDKIEKEVGNEMSTSTNKELNKAYGLVYKSDKGEFKTQLEALENYILGHKMTLEEVNNIETYKKDEQNTSLPKPGTDLAVACELNIAEYIDLINQAAQSRIEQNCARIGVGEQIRIYNSLGQIKTSFAFIATDYNGKIVYSDLELFIAHKDSNEIKSEREKAETNSEIAQWLANIEGYENYMLGRTPGEASAVETYSNSSGTATKIPCPYTDLATVCNVDLSDFINVVSEASSRSK